MSFAQAPAMESQPGTRARLMLISDHRVLYFGLLGRPGLRNFGCATLYVAEHHPFELDLGCGWQNHYVVRVPPHTPHRIRSRDQHLAVVMLEPEYTVTETLGPCIHELPTSDAMTLRMKVLGGLGRLQRQVPAMDLGDETFDQMLFGRILPCRRLDARISRVVDHLCTHADDGSSAASLAEGVGLSLSRFLHLFKEQTGVSLRKYRAWRRARSLLYHVRSDDTLTAIALETGYPDSTHFSHSIRRIYGLPPREIVNGSRRLQIRVQSSSFAASSHKSVPQSVAMV